MTPAELFSAEVKNHSGPLAVMNVIIHEALGPVHPRLNALLEKSWRATSGGTLTDFLETHREELIFLQGSNQKLVVIRNDAKEIMVIQFYHLQGGELNIAPALRLQTEQNGQGMTIVNFITYFTPVDETKKYEVPVDDPDHFGYCQEGYSLETQIGIFAKLIAQHMPALAPQVHALVGKYASNEATLKLT